MAERESTAEIHRFIIDHISDHPADIAGLAAKHFGITTQAINRHLRKLIEKNVLKSKGNNTRKQYELAATFELNKTYAIKGLNEDIPWTYEILPQLKTIDPDTRGIVHYAFTEILNNAIDHSEADSVFVSFTLTPKLIDIIIWDKGVGIFKKVATSLNLADESQAILELSKGKFTTDPKRHSGEGIFFTSRAVDHFSIRSGNLYFVHRYDEVSGDRDWIIEVENEPMEGTCVFMKISTDNGKTLREVFDQYTSDPEQATFSKTIIPLTLAKYGNDNLVSRSQAKRVLARLEGFKSVIFDFSGVETIGQGFADEIFRVFTSQHPDVNINAINYNDEVFRMIRHVTEGSTSNG